MFHTHTRRLIDEWRAQRNGQSALPQRASISPVAFGPLLPQLFILGGEPDGQEFFRLSGGLLADLHGRDLKGADFFSLWRREDRVRLADAIARARAARSPLVITAAAAAVTGECIGLEISLAPVLGSTGVSDRIIGLYQPISMTARLVGKPVAQLSVRALTVVDELETAPSRRAHLRLVVDNGRRVA